MPLAPKYSKAISDIASLMYDFLPGNPHPRANPAISFKGIAEGLGLSQFWVGGSKLPAINMLLLQTYEYEKGKFCNLIISIVNSSIPYRSKKNPIVKSEIVELNNLILRLDFKIPELWDNFFLDSLVDDTSIVSDTVSAEQVDYEELLSEFLKLHNLDAQTRGFAFEKFLNLLFERFGLNPRKPFRLIGEQIDGSLELGGIYYLIEAKWQKEPLGNKELLAFYGKIDGKSTWSRGIIISYAGFSKEGLEAFRRGRPTNLIAINGQDLYALLSQKISLVDGLEKKLRWAAETGEIAKSIFELELIYANV